MMKNNERQKKVKISKIALLLALVIFLVSMPMLCAAANWIDFDTEVNENGNLTLSKYYGDNQFVILPAMIDGEQVTAIGEDFCMESSNMSNAIIENGIENIADYAFTSCEELVRVCIPESVISIGEDAFSYNVESVIVNKMNENYSDLKGVLYNKDKSELIFYPMSRKQASFELPDTVKKIEPYAIVSDNLSYINVEKGNKFFSAEDGVLFNKEKDSLVFYPLKKEDTNYSVPNGVKTLTESCFFYNQNLETITIPNTVEIIEPGAFSDCRNIKTIKLPDSVTSIGDSAFFSCNALETITIPDSVTSIEVYTFGYCEALKTVNIPGNVKKIGWSAFSECTALETITIPDSVTIIEEDAFAGCYELVIKCTEGSYAHEYANENDIEYELI